MFENVPGLGTVILPPATIRKLHMDLVGTRELEDVLTHGEDVRARSDHSVVGREWRGIRLVFKKHPDLAGSAVVCVDGYRVTE